MTNEMLSILKNEDSLVILKEISSSNIQVSDIRKLLEITQKLNNFGLNGIKEILEHAEDLLDVKRHFHFMKETGENIEKLFSETLESEQLQIDIQTQGWGSHDFMISNKLDPQKRIFIELKSYKNGTNHDFKFASSQVKKSLENPEDYFVCMLERPENDVPATVEYLKTKLQYKTNLSNLTMEVISDIKDFERINSRNGAVKLVIDQRQEPRVHIAFPLMQENSQSFYQLITEIKNRLI